MRTTLKQRCQILFCVLGMLLWFLAGILQVCAVAADDKGSLTMICQTEKDVILSGVEWKIYCVGGRDADGALELRGDFARYPVSLKDTSESALRDAAETLESYAISYDLEYVDIGTTDSTGRVKFDKLPRGLYLLSGSHTVVEDTTYFYSAFLIEVPSAGTDELDLLAYPKSDAMNWTEETHTLKKIWLHDEEMTMLRPPSITVQIHCDGELYETVVLNEANNWTYQWQTTEIHKWNVIEVDVPRFYAVTYTSSGVQYAIVNSYDEEFDFWENDTVETSVTETIHTTMDSTASSSVTESETAKTTESGEQTTVTETQKTTEKTTYTTTSASTTSTRTTTQTTAKPEKLPQTGQLWWPVPLLAIAGLISIGIGMKLYTKE